MNGRLSIASPYEYSYADYAEMCRYTRLLRITFHQSAYLLASPRGGAHKLSDMRFITTSKKAIGQEEPYQSEEYAAILSEHLH